MDIEELLEGYAGMPAPDEQSTPTVERTDLSKLLGDYSACMNRFSHDDRLIGRAWVVKEHVKKVIADTLWPFEISTFFEMTVDFEGRPNYSEVTGLFVSRLIQNSYDAGHTYFIINTAGTPIDMLASYLEGKKEEPLAVVIQGDVGSHGANYSTWVDMRVRGSAGHYFGAQTSDSKFNVGRSVGQHVGHHAKNADFTIMEFAGKQAGFGSEGSKFVIHGNADWGLGWNAQGTEFVVTKNTGGACGASAKKCRFDIRGGAGKNCGYNAEESEFDVRGAYGPNVGGHAKHCTFTTYDEAMMEHLTKNVAAENLNKIRYLDHNGGVKRFLRR